MSTEIKPRADTLPAPAKGDLAEQEVADFLRRNPDFLARHTHLLDGMQPPRRWTGDGIVDMQKFMLDQLRGELDSLRASTQEVIETTRSNLSIQSRVHAAVLALLQAEDFEHMIRTVGEDLPILLDVDVVTLGFEPAETPLPALASSGIRPLEAGTVDRLLGKEQDYLLQSDAGDDGTLFDSASGLVRSFALARLRPGGRVAAGLLALGSRKSVFHPGQGTELIGFLARVVERSVQAWLERPE